MATSKRTTPRRRGGTVTNVTNGNDAFAATRERRLRQWAAKIVSELPPDQGDAAAVLCLAEKLRGEWLEGAQ